MSNDLQTAQTRLLQATDDFNTALQSANDEALIALQKTAASAEHQLKIQRRLQFLKTLGICVGAILITHLAPRDGLLWDFLVFVGVFRTIRFFTE